MIPLSALDNKWRDYAICSTSDPELFFPPIGANAQEAKKICFRCPVKDECLTEAIRYRVPYGIWGGKSPNERQRLRRLAHA